MKIYTIGFTKKSAQTFFELLREAQVRTLIDVRLNNVSQLAGFTKRDDLKYFLDQICGIHYSHRVDLAPTQSMLDDYKKREVGWAVYEARFLELMEQRRIEDTVPKELLDNAALLCSEEKPLQCHRRLVVEYLSQHWADIEIQHLT